MNFWRYLQLFLISLLSSVNTYSQVGIGAEKQNTNFFDEVNKLYRETKLNDTVYMQMIDSVAALSLDKGAYYSVSEMSDNMKQYEKIAWNKKEYGSYRIDYFLILLNNAYLSRKWGSSIFYAEKVAKQSEKEGMVRSLIEPSVKMYIYSLTDREDKQIEVYEKNKELFQDLLVKVQKAPDVYYWEGMDALRILSPIINTYFGRKETLKAKEAYEMANSLIRSIRNNSGLSVNSKQILGFYAIAFDFYKLSGHGQKEDALIELNKIDFLLKKGRIIGDEYDYNLLDWKANLFLEMKRVDSASFYINKLETVVGFAQNQKTLIYKYKARLENLKGNPQKTIEYLNKALDESFDVQVELSEEMDGLLYAQTEAEHHRLAFEKSEAEKRKRNIWIVIVSSSLIVVIIGGIVLLRLKDRKLRRTLKDLGETADIYVALMKQLEFEVRKEEQQLLSQNLHDDLAGTLAAIKNNIDLQVVDADENKKRQELLRLSEMLNEVYHSVRNKSHQLFKGAQLPSEEIFCQYITNLAHIAFPDKYYDFNIQIDDYSLVNTTTEFRSELIRVIQEAFANIVKHAKATQVDLLIYKESEKISIVIKDNGKGFGTGVKGDALGVLNMQSRLKQFDADFSVNSDNSGVEITITIPENTTVT